MADKNTGNYGTLRILVSEGATSATGNWSDVAWELWFNERVSAPSTRHLTADIPASVAMTGEGTVYSGAFAFDWRPAGLQTQRLASGTTRVTHDPDGSGSVTVTGSIGDTGTSGGGGPTSVSQGLTLTTLRVVPGTPSSVVASRVSDALVGLSWAQSSASNGQPDQNVVRRKINSGGWATAVTISPATSASLAAAINQKLVYGVMGTNDAGDSGWSADSNPVFTSPAAPSDVVAVKDASLNIVVSWTPNVGFSEHEHVIVHGTVTGGVTSWDGSPLGSVGSGTSTFTDTAPDAAKVHVYKVYAQNTDTAGLTSAEVTSNTVQLLAAPNKPTLAALGPFVDKGKTFVIPWTHNPVDSTAQTAYEFGYSTNGGSSWSTTGKVTSTTSSKSFAASTYSAGDELTIRVRTYGQSATVSPWSDQQTVTFKTRPVVTITGPANSSTYVKSKLFVELGFSQAEAATFVSATIGLYQGATLLETKLTTTRASTLLDTRVQDGVSYTVKVTVTDSNGLVSNQATSTFSVAYTLPVAAGVTVTYLPDSGIAQLELTIGAPGSGESAATTVTITREIGGVSEVVVEDYPKAASLTILDMTPTVHGTNHYTVTTISGDGATTDVFKDLVTTEPYYGFLSTGDGFADIINFAGNLAFGSAPKRKSVLVATAGRTSPVVLFSDSTELVVSGSADLTDGLGSTAQDVEAFILTADVVCYRDPSGRRMFGQLDGSVDSPSSLVSNFQYKVTRASQ